MNKDEQYMMECIELARTAEGQTSPNPLVGAIVLNKNGEIVAKGYHSKCGEAHAEVCALNEAGTKAQGGTLYVNLEPCSHFGKTPPCADRVIKSGVKRVVIGMKDPNPLVEGKGIDKILQSDIEVHCGVLEKECKKLNEIFIKHIIQKKPFIAIKIASTMDGKIATKTFSSKWITSEKAREEVQRLRNKYDAIITGSGTVIKDDPSLTCRKVNGKNPVRIIIDSKLKTSPDARVYKDDNTKVIIATAAENTEKYPDNVELLKCPLTQEGKIDLDFLINRLYEKGISSILIEAGGILNGAFIKTGLADKIYFFTAPKILGDNQAYSSFEGFSLNNISECISLKFDEVKAFPPDIMIEAYLDYK